MPEKNLGFFSLGEKPTKAGTAKENCLLMEILQFKLELKHTWQINLN